VNDVNLILNDVMLLGKLAITFSSKSIIRQIKNNSG